MKKTSQSKHVGLVFDPKVAGEANHRPQLRVPPLRLATSQSLIDLARGRVGAVVGGGDDGGWHGLAG